MSRARVLPGTNVENAQFAARNIQWLENGMSLDFSQYTDADPHLSSGERILSILVGLGLTSLAAQPRSNVFVSLFALAGGSYLAYRGATGFCPVKASLNSDHPKLGASVSSKA